MKRKRTYIVKHKDLNTLTYKHYLYECKKGESFAEYLFRSIHIVKVHPIFDTIDKEEI